MALTLGLSAGACGSSPPPDPDAVFATIQVHEADLAHASAEAQRCAPTDDCAAVARACEAAEALCEAAEPLDDEDASARCELGRRRCRALRRADRSGP